MKIALVSWPNPVRIDLTVFALSQTASVDMKRWLTFFNILTLFVLPCLQHSDFSNFFIHTADFSCSCLQRYRASGIFVSSTFHNFVLIFQCLNVKSMLSSTQGKFIYSVTIFFLEMCRKGCHYFSTSAYIHSFMVKIVDQEDSPNRITLA